MNVDAFIATLPLIGKGLGGVFTVIILIWLSIAALVRMGKGSTK